MEIIKNEFLHKTPVPLLVTRHETKKGAVALSISAQLLFLCKKITARPRKNPAVGVKLSYATN